MQGTTFEKDNNRKQETGTCSDTLSLKSTREIIHMVNTVGLSALHHAPRVIFNIMKVIMRDTR